MEFRELLNEGFQEEILANKLEDYISRSEDELKTLKKYIKKFKTIDENKRKEFMFRLNTTVEKTINQLRKASDILSK